MHQITIVDVTPRDGLQDASGYVPVEDKVALIEGLVAAGVRVVEVASFVHPKWIPLLADADSVVPRLSHLSIDRVSLAPNERGVVRAAAAGSTSVTLVASASEGHNRANLNKSRAETLAELRQAVKRARDAGLRVRGAISTSFDCPFDGVVPLQNVLYMAEGYLDMGVDELSIADTIGSATPNGVEDRVKALNGIRGAVPLSLHLHDRNGQALDNVAVGLHLGVTCFESALGSLGGCPYAPGAAGNLDTEHLVQFIERQGLGTGINLEALAPVRERLLKVLARRLSAS